MAEIVVGRIVIERRMDDHGDMYVWVVGNDASGGDLSDVEALGMIEVAKALITTDIAVDDS